MRTKLLILAFALIVTPSLAVAAPITAGSWSLVAGSADADSVPFWDGWSWDGPYEGVGYMLNANSNPTIEYLHDATGEAVRFRFDETVSTTFFDGITAWSSGVLGRSADGAFTYTTGPTGIEYSYDSWNNPEQFVLFRVVGAETVQYYLGVEDMPLSSELNDWDYNDHVVSFTQPASVPEPGTLLLLGVGALGMLGRRAARRRPAANV
jgi:hypothetical protein